MVRCSGKQFLMMALLAALGGNLQAAQIKGPSTQQTPYVVGTAPGVKVVSIASNGNGTTTPDETYGGYRLVGIPDGAGAWDNGDGTFTMLVGHELPATAGVVRAHGSAGAFVSKWVINSSDLSVVSGSDLISQTYVWNTTSQNYVQQTTAFTRFCSADLPSQSAFFNAASGLGTTEKLFLTGEETGSAGASQPYGRVFAAQASGSDAGKAWQLAELGRIPWENALASPHAQDQTIVMGTDDGGRTFTSEGGGDPSQLYVYVGQKTNSGLAIDKAGLTNGQLHGLKVAGRLNEDQIVNGDRFTLFDYSTDISDDTTGFALEAENVANGVTEFRRVEDGVWDPINKDVFYFLTTDTTTPSGGRSQLWKVTFDDISNPQAGGTIEALLEGTEGAEMLDNMTAVANGSHTQLIMQEDVGNNSRLSRHWLYNVSDDSLLEIATFDSARFGEGPTNGALTTPVTAPFTRDEEASGIIPAPWLGEGWFLGTVQAHYNISGELVQGGQLYAMYVPQTVPEPSTWVLLSLGAVAVGLNQRRRTRQSSRTGK